MTNKKTDSQGTLCPVYPDDLERVNGFLLRFSETVGATLSPIDASGFSEIPYGELRIGVNVRSNPGLLFLVVAVADLPKSPPATALQALLELNYMATGPCAFAIDDSKHKVYLRVISRLETLSCEEFERLLKTLVTVAGNTLSEVRKTFGL